MHEKPFFPYLDKSSAHFKIIAHKVGLLLVDLLNCLFLAILLSFLITLLFSRFELLFKQLPPIRVKLGLNLTLSRLCLPLDKSTLLAIN